ncbi:MAG: triose-phosphate isomerase [Gammaproteobacteria bacterium]|nr:triose-phosphate isomerase [Gammaproteobacteria bacterium]
MRKPLIAGNWKMHGSSAFVADYAAALTAPGADVELLLLPPAPYLRELQTALHGMSVELGVQNVHDQPEGAYTGELSAEMARDLGAGWALVGHSERRALCGETDAVVAAKVVAARRAGLAALLCVGETLAEREAGSAEAVVQRQIRALADHAGVEAFSGLTIAYEPVWAIGTGRTATPEQAQEMHALVRQCVGDLCGRPAAARLRVLYGGSVKPDNAAALLGQTDIDGALVGGAALKAADFAAIAAAAGGTTIGDHE